MNWLTSRQKKNKKNQDWIEPALDRTSIWHNLKLNVRHLDGLPSWQNQSGKGARWTDCKVDWTKSESNQELTELIVDTILRGQNVLWQDYQDRQNSSRQTPSWTDFQEDGTKRKQNAELKEQIVDTILLGENVMWPDSKVDQIQEDKHLVGQIHKRRELRVSWTRFERPYGGQKILWTNCHMGRLPSVQNPSSQTPMWTECQLYMISNRKIPSWR